jgi:hypothetical protein
MTLLKETRIKIRGSFSSFFFKKKFGLVCKGFKKNNLKFCLGLENENKNQTIFS